MRIKSTGKLKKMRYTKENNNGTKLIALLVFRQAVHVRESSGSVSSCQEHYTVLRQLVFIFSVPRQHRYHFVNTAIAH